jgi:hypothetical protein
MNLYRGIARGSHRCVWLDVSVKIWPADLGAARACGVPKDKTGFVRGGILGTGGVRNAWPLAGPMSGRAVWG